MQRDDATLVQRASSCLAFAARCLILRASSYSTMQRDDASRLPVGQRPPLSRDSFLSSFAVMNVRAVCLSLSHAHTHTHLHTPLHTHTLELEMSQVPCARALSLAHTHTRVRAHTRAHTRTNTHAHVEAGNEPDTRSVTLSLALIHTHTHTLEPKMSQVPCGAKTTETSPSRTHRQLSHLGVRDEPGTHSLSLSLPPTHTHTHTPWSQR